MNSFTEKSEPPPSTELRKARFEDFRISSFRLTVRFTIQLCAKGLAALLLMIALGQASGAVRLDAEGEGVEYSSQYFDWDAGGVTIMAWVYVVNDPGAADSAIVSIRGAGILYIDAARKLQLYTGSSQTWTINTVVSVRTWHHCALVRDGSVWRAYIDGVADVFATQLVEPTGDPRPRFGNDNYHAWLDGRIAAGKIWLASLSPAEIQAEMASSAPVRTANIWSVVPMTTHTNLTDQSGLGNTPTAMGVLSTEDGPPVLARTNWQTLGTVTANTNGSFLFIDSDASPKRLYRSLSTGATN